MRNAMMAMVVLALLDGLARARAGQPLVRASELAPPRQQRTSAMAISKALGSPPATTTDNRFSLGSDTTTYGKADSTEWAARMFTAGRSNDFGAVPFGTRLLHRFEITNVYAIPVEIVELRVGCGCVTATAGKRTLRPGERTTIDVALDTRAFTGANTETVRVIVGPNPKSFCLLKVSAISETNVVFKPDRIINLGEVVRGRASAQSIDIEYCGTLAWEISKVVVARDLHIEATLSGPVRRSGTVAYRLTVKLKDDALEGRIREYVYLKTNQVDAPLVPVRVMANVRASPKEAVGISSSE